MDPMPPPEPVVPSLPPRSTPIPQPGGFPGWGAAPMPPPGPPAAPTWGGPQFPYGMPLAPMARTYGLATAALVCGLIGLVTFWLLGIVPLLGLIFGLISARAIKRSGGTLSGLGKARAGWIMGLIGVVGASAFFWAGVTGRLDKETETTTDADNNPATSPYIEAEVGDCVGSIPEDDVVYELEFVSCAVAHSAEVYLVGKLNEDGTRAYPGDSALLAEVEQKCDEGFDPYVGRSYEQSVYEIFYLYPRAFGWKPEQGIYFCFLGEVGKTNVGSAFHSDR